MLQIGASKFSMVESGGIVFKYAMPLSTAKLYYHEDYEEKEVALDGQLPSELNNIYLQHLTISVTITLWYLYPRR